VQGPRRHSRTESDSPQALRLKRRQRHQVSCARVVLLLVLLVVGMANRGWLAGRLGLGRSRPEAAEARPRFPLQLIVKTPVCYRYDLVPVILEARDAGNRAAPLPEPPVIRVLYAGEPQTTVGHVDRLSPGYDRQLVQYRAWWPVPWNAKPGRYVVEARCDLKDVAAWDWDGEVREAGEGEDNRIAEVVCRRSFTIRARTPARIAPGLCAVTWEQHIPTGRVQKPDGAWGDWRALLDWAEFMGADALWCRGAITKVDKSWSLSMEQPFVPTDQEMMHRVAREAHRRGLKFGTWAVAFSTFPHNSNAGKPPYRFAQAVRPDGSLANHDFVSLLDEDRPRQLAEFLQRMAQDANVDMVGFDYFRPDRGGFEISDQFAKRMPVNLPAGFARWPQSKRWAYVARKVEYEWRSDPDFYEQWNWFRTHLLTQRLVEVRRLAKADKPVWVFMFGWYHGQQIGQDPLMLTDAGADALAVMLYQVESLEHFKLMTSQWREYLEAGNCNLLPGDQVDFLWHQKMTQPRAAPEELYRRMMVAHSSFQKGSVCTGAFWHDISRALTGRFKPYTGREWALAGAAAFSAIRRSWQVYPLAAELLVPEEVSVGEPFQAKLRLKSLVARPVSGIEISLEDTPQVQGEGSTARRVPELPAGAELAVPWDLKVRAHDPRRGDRFMVALRIEWADGDYGAKVRRDAPRTLVVMKWLNAR